MRPSILLCALSLKPVKLFGLRKLPVEKLHHELLVKELRRGSVLVELTDVLQLGVTGNDGRVYLESLVVLRAERTLAQA